MNSDLITRILAGYIAELASADAVAESMEAVVGFNDYYTVDDVVNFVADYDININRVYMWPKGETGRLSIKVQDNDILGSINAFKTRVDEQGLGDDEQAASGYQRFLNGEFEVFAVTVDAPVEALEALNAEANCISYIDVMYNEGIETYAARANKAVSYIELPAKPDGAL
ncbi:MAG: hypothetical protein NC548_65225 [Lachnospiraceae bacterium]|nr:hypothetical protein [Lachnospiraceae bacterium]